MTIEAFAQRWAQTAVLADQPPAVQAAVQADRLRSTPAGLAAALRGLRTGALPSLWERLAELTAPVDLVVGERDAKFPAIAREMAAALPEPACTWWRAPATRSTSRRPARDRRGLAAGRPSTSR